MNKIIERVYEPSTWAGVAAILQALGFFFPQYAVLVNAGTVLAGCAATAMPEGQKSEPNIY